MRICLVLFIFLSSIVKGFGQDEIEVHLSSVEKRIPVFLHILESKEDPIDRSYLTKLEDIFIFDLNHNGRTQLVAKTKERKEHASQENDLRCYDGLKWRALGVSAVVRAIVSKQSISIVIFSTESGQLQGIEKVSLFGNLSQDRLIIHQLSDAIHACLFKQPGIADTKILYTLRTRSSQDSTQWISEVWECDYDGANKRQITHENSLCVTPTYIPSYNANRCTHFMFVSYKIGQPKIYLASLKDGQSDRLTYLKSNQFMPACAPMKKLISFVSDVAGNPDLFLQSFDSKMNLQGKPYQIFSAPSAAQGSPSFSPDGKRIAFVSNKDGTPRIYILSIPEPQTPLEDIKPLLISKKNRDNTSPAWSFDGTKIAYSAMTQGTRQIWVYDLITKQEKQLTEGKGHKENPAWAPDSFHLVFNSSTDNKSELYLINLNQKEAVQITSGSGEKRFPAWEPKNLSAYLSPNFKSVL